MIGPIKGLILVVTCPLIDFIKVLFAGRGGHRSQYDQRQSVGEGEEVWNPWEQKFRFASLRFQERVKVVV